MKRRFFCTALAMLAATVIGMGSVQAGTVVMTDSGNIGQFRATNMGVSGGTATVVFDIPNFTSQLNTVNGLFLATPEQTAVPGPVTLLVTSTGPETYNLSLVPSTYEQTIGATPATQAILDFTLTKGVAPDVLPNFFNMSGAITSLVTNSNPNLDFSKFEPGGFQNVTLTATSFQNAASFAGFLATPGAVAVGNGSFSQSAVPEPASAALLGIGLSGIFALQRLFRRSACKA